jgi:nucleotide-binding universal stress UspA family protein
MDMFRRILVPTDGSEQLTEALPQVKRLASRDGASVLFVCVEPRAVNMGDIIDNRAALTAHAARVRVIEDHVEDLQTAGIEASYIIEFGRPEHGIETAATHHASDVILMIPQRRDGLDALLHPSVTTRVFSSSPAPLLILPPRDENTAVEPQKELLGSPEALVVMPLDGSELAERALPAASAIAEEYQRGLQLVRVVPPPPEVSVYADAYERAQPRYRELVDEAHRYLDAIRARVEKETGLSVRVNVTMGAPAGEIVDIARECPDNLIVMSTHGHGTLGRLLLGSVATDVMRSATVPMLVVPPNALIVRRTEAGQPVGAQRE